MLASPLGNSQQERLISWVYSLVLSSALEVESYWYLDDLFSTEGANPVGLVVLVGLAADILLLLIGLLGCFMSHKHIIPSFENDAILLANCVPITLSEFTGYLWASAETPSLCIGIDFTLISQSKSWPL